MRPWLLAMLTACGPSQGVTWDRVGGGDSFDDVAVALLLFGKVEGDRSALQGPHLAGGTLEMEVAASGLAPRPSDGWRVTSLNPEIVEVVSQTPEGERLRVELGFVGEGETELFVFDDVETVLDVQHVHVEEPDGVSLQAWDDLTAGIERDVSSPLRVAAGSDADVAVRWTDARGTVLAGSGILEVEAEPPPGATVRGRSTAEADLLEIDLEATAELGRFEVGLYALAEPVAELGVDVVDPDDIDGVEPHVVVHSQDPELGTTGAVLAELYVGDDRVIGGEVAWFGLDDESLGTGAVLLWAGEPGQQSEVTACFGTICATSTIDGLPTAVSGAEAPSGDGLGCGCGGAPPRATGLLSLLARRVRGGAAPRSPGAR